MHFKRADDYHPDIVVIMLGTNDANRDIAQNENSFEADYSQLSLLSNSLKVGN